MICILQQYPFWLRIYGLYLIPKERGGMHDLKDVLYLIKSSPAKRLG